MYNTFAVYLIKYSKINIHIESEMVESILVKHILNNSIYENHYSIYFNKAEKGNFPHCFLVSQQSRTM